MRPALTHLLYLHGFRSSPHSTKARMLAHAVSPQQLGERAPQWACPQLPPSPAQAAADIRALIAGWPVDSMMVVGSSLGGFYATWVAELTGCEAVVINPAVAPARDLAKHIGQQSQFHDPTDTFFFRAEFIDEFRALAPYPIRHSDRYHALITTGDEVLDWREMRASYQGADIALVEGSDHAVTDFASHLPTVLRWLRMTPQADLG